MAQTNEIRAFISYSHKDVDFARWLQKALEHYRLPKDIWAGTDPHDTARTIGRIFRDQSDLSAAASLSDAVRDALARAGALIVIASPDSQSSHWVEQEITLFRTLHPDRPILVAHRNGEPHRDWPPALLTDGQEPLAADFRDSADGKRLALLKLIGGLINVPLDRLVQRDAARRVRRVTAVTLIALLALLIMAGVAFVAVQARQEAERQRGEAEKLVEYMMTDLRSALRGVGRLDVMSGVNRRAMGYYDAQGALSDASESSLSRRARILHAMGEDQITLGHQDRALTYFQAAHRSTSEMVRRAPGHGDALFAHAQSEFWIGNLALLRGDMPTAKAHFERYAAMADRLARLFPGHRLWSVEAGYAANNLGVVAMKSGQTDAALSQFEKAVAILGQHSQASPRDDRLRLSHADSLCWLADTHVIAEQFAKAHTARLTARRIYADLRAHDPANAEYRLFFARNEMGLAWIEAQQGTGPAAQARLSENRALIAQLRALEPANTDYQTLESSNIQLSNKVRSSQ